MEANSKENVAAFSAGGGEEEEEEEEEEEKDKELLKRRISCHPLYSLLIKTHLDCLKVSMGDIEEIAGNASNQANNKPNTSIPSCSHLDHFMETYCTALCELKESMEKPVEETTTFINGMYVQLMELNGTLPPLPAPTSSGGQESRWTHHHKGTHFISNWSGSTREPVIEDFTEPHSMGGMPSGLLGALTVVLLLTCLYFFTSFLLWWLFKDLTLPII